MQIKKGTGFSFGSETELNYADILCSRCTNFDKIRFMNSGTEAVMNAIKAARAYTGKSKIVKCENSYECTECKARNETCQHGQFYYDS